MEIIQTDTDDLTGMEKYHSKLVIYGKVSKDAHETVETNSNSASIRPRGRKKTLSVEADVIENVINDKLQNLLGRSFDKSIILKKYNKFSRLTIKETSLLKVIIDLIMGLATYYSVITSLIYLGYEGPGDDQYKFDIFIWILFIIDFILSFLVEYKDLNKISVRNFKMIAKHYAITWMIFDIASLLPLNLAGYPDAEYFLRLFRILKLKRLFQIISKSKINNFVQHCLKKEDTKKLRTMKILVSYIWNLIVQIIFMLIISFSISCLWSYFAKTIRWKENENDNFYYHFNLNENSVGEKVIKFWYFIFTTLMTVGYGDFYATNKFEMGFCILLLIIGPSWYAYAMGKSIETIKKLEDVENVAELNTEVDNFLAVIDYHYKEIPIKLKEQIMNHFEFYFQNDRAGPLAEKYWRYEDKKELEIFHNKFLAEMPKAESFKLLDILFAETFNKFRVFFGRNDDFRFYLCLHIQPRLYKSKEIIFNIESHPKEVLFLEKGEVCCGRYINNIFHEFYKYKDHCSIIADFYVINKAKPLGIYIAGNFASGFSIKGSIIRYVLNMFPIRKRKFMNFSMKKASLVERSINEGLGNLNEEEKNNNDDEKQKLMNRKSVSTRNLGGIKKKSKHGKKESFQDSEFRELNKQIQQFKRTNLFLAQNIKDSFLNLAKCIPEDFIKKADDD
ncbi:hypothetical protein SteCoe_21873 [Stentor coeruleus]|uniref:Potassium channel domain-containing protein n=1 Tax=Stentor coeruleus TaxID=5963 RepID=A0A1R2BNI2_9CILI|nr:hypothetical protein SteCoe_31137 [Stentor coeruleus]OMJ78318.1 hypothetical protein SteCoe_21873 [Stentor coeruleus]